MDEELDDSRHYVTVVIRFADEVDELGLGFLKQLAHGLADVTCVTTAYSLASDRQAIDARYHQEQEVLARMGNMP